MTPVGMPRGAKPKKIDMENFKTNAGGVPGKNRSFSNPQCRADIAEVVKVTSNALSPALRPCYKFPSGQVEPQLGYRGKE